MSIIKIVNDNSATYIGRGREITTRVLKWTFYICQRFKSLDMPPLNKTWTEKHFLSFLLCSARIVMAYLAIWIFDICLSLTRYQKSRVSERSIEAEFFRVLAVYKSQTFTNIILVCMD